MAESVALVRAAFARGALVEMEEWVDGLEPEGWHHTMASFDELAARVRDQLKSGDGWALWVDGAEAACSDDRAVRAAWTVAVGGVAPAGR